jgi:serine/threonine-protein kinase
MLEETRVAPDVDDPAPPPSVGAADPWSVARDRVGTTLLGKWYLEELLGVGGMAAVYAATHRNGLRGAVKILHRDLARGPIIRERLRREGYLANRVGARGAVRVLDEDETEDGHVFLVMELLEGQTLERMAEARGGRLPLDLVLQVGAQALETLAAAHEAGVFHRDVKPDNLFYTIDGETKILDFGIARLRETQLSPALTQTGQAMGTPAFMAPEQARGRWDEVDERSDVYAMGATLFTLLSGELVHGDQGTVAEIMAATFLRQARPIRSVVPETPEAVAEVIDRALRLDKAQRWASAREMLTALRAAKSGPARRTSRPRRIAALGAAFVLALAIMVGMKLSPRTEVAEASVLARASVPAPTAPSAAAPTPTAIVRAVDPEPPPASSASHRPAPRKPTIYDRRN